MDDMLKVGRPLMNDFNVGRPLMNDFNNAIAAFSLEDVMDPYAATRKLIDGLSQTARCDTDCRKDKT
jgi:hypothetical protein